MKVMKYWMSALLLVSTLSLHAQEHRYCFGPLNQDKDQFIYLSDRFSAKTLIQSGDKMTDGAKFPYRPDLTVYMPIGDERALVVISHELARDENPARGSASLTQHYYVDGKFEKSKMLANGMRKLCSGGLTPWGTILANEEFPRDAKKYPNEGFIWEVDPITGKRWRRDAMGRYSHESSLVAKDGSVYLTEDYEDGLLYRFVPDERGDLSRGSLYAYNRDRRFWVDIDKPVDARRRGILNDATPFHRLEGLAFSRDAFF